ncbi:hypothetical protein [Maritalea sp.]|uniref:hypothetical protein n=1 Tax=Maritalea sp. TaxID=2003361 RepID=UPI003EF808EF
MNPPSLIDELVAAARGCFGILLGREQEIKYLDGSWPALISSAIAALLAIGVQAMLKLPLPEGVVAPIPVMVLLHLVAVNVAGFYGVYLFLRAKGRGIDMFRYIAAHNWSNLFFLSATLILVFALPGLMGSLAITIATAVFYVRAATHLLNVRGADLVLMIGAQLLAMLACVILLMIIGGFIPGLGFYIPG